MSMPITLASSRSQHVPATKILLNNSLVETNADFFCLCLVFARPFTSAMQAYSSQSTSAYGMPTSGFYGNGGATQSPYGVLSPATYTAMAVPATRALGQQCKNAQSLGKLRNSFLVR